MGKLGDLSPEVIRRPAHLAPSNRPRGLTFRVRLDLMATMDEHPTQTIDDAEERALARAWRWVTTAPAYASNAGDLRSVKLLGLRLPVRATVAVVAVALLLLL